MKKPLRALVLLVLAAAAGFMLHLASRPAPEPVEGEARPRETAVAAVQERGGYCLRAVDGRLALYRDGSEIAPLAETGINIEQLRAVDRKKLEEGIWVRTYEEVLQLLEDFNS